MTEQEIRLKCLEIAFAAYPGAEESAKKLAQKLFDWVVQRKSVSTEGNGG